MVVNVLFSEGCTLTEYPVEDKAIPMSKLWFRNCGTMHDTRNLPIKTVSLSPEHVSLTQGQYVKLSSSLYHTTLYCGVDENQTKLESLSETDCYTSLRAQMSVFLKKDKLFWIRLSLEKVQFILCRFNSLLYNLINGDPGPTSLQFPFGLDCDQYYNSKWRQMRNDWRYSVFTASLLQLRKRFYW